MEENKNKYVGMFEMLRHSSSPIIAGALVKRTKKLDKAIELLKKLEWKYDSDYDVYKCPCCERIQENGHMENCELKNLISNEV